MKKLKRLKLALYEVADIKCEMVQVKVVAFSKIDKTKKKFIMHLILTCIFVHC